MTSSKGFLSTSITVFYNSIQFLACLYKTVTYVWCYLNLICLLFQNIEISDNSYLRGNTENCFEWL